MINSNESLADQVKINRRFLKSVRIDTDASNAQALDGFIPLQSSLNVLDFMSKTILSGNNYAFTWSGAFGSGKSTLALLLSAFISSDEKLKRKALSFIKDYSNDEGKNNISKLFASKKSKSDLAWKGISIVGTNDSLRAVLGQRLNSDYGIKPSSDKKTLCSEDLLQWIELLKQNNIRVMLIIDELGKFLHHALETHDIYFLQELAEVASRSDGHLIVLGIMHQSFDAYIATFDKRVVDEWSKVQGRFENILLAPSVFESLKVVAGSIDNDGYSSAFKSDSLTKDIFKQSQAFADSINDSFKQCLPLHPVSALLLCALSRKSFGQNERTIFGFLNSHEPFSFSSFLSSTAVDSKELYLPDQLFDYIANNQAMMMASGSDGHLYTEALETLHRIEADCSYEQLTLFKTIVVIDILGKTYGLRASNTVLKSCYSLFKYKSYYSTDAAFENDFKACIDTLIEKKAVIFKKYEKAYACFQGSDFDFEGEFTKAYSQTVFNQDTVRNLLSESETVVAKRHYVNTGNLRFFDVELVSEKEVIAAALKTASANDSVGKAFLVCMSSDEYDSAYSAEVIHAILHCSAHCKNNIFAVALKSHEIIRKARSLSAYQMMSSLPALEGDKAARREIQMRISSSEAELSEIVSHSLSDSLIINNGSIRAKIVAKHAVGLNSNLKDAFFKKGLFPASGYDFNALSVALLSDEHHNEEDKAQAMIAWEEMQIPAVGCDLESFQDNYCNRKGAIQRILSTLHENAELKLVNADIRALASEIADDLYSKAPVVKNELINRNKLSSSAAKARRVLMESMCESASQVDLGFEKTPAEANIYWTIFLKNRMHRLSADGQTMEFVCDNRTDPAYAALFKDTLMFISERKQASALEIFKFWSAPPYGIKDGMHLLLMLFFILVNKDNVAVYNKNVFATDFSKSLVDELLVNNDEFSFKFFGSTESDKLMTDNTVKALKDAGVAVSGTNPLMLARSLVAFALRLPMLTQKTIKLGRRAQNLKSQLLNASDPIDLLFDKLPAIYPDLANDASELTADLEEIKAFYPDTLKSVEELLFKSLGHDGSAGVTTLNNRAKNIQSLGNNFKLEQLAGKLAVYSGLQGNVEGIITICTDKPRQSWTDRDINATMAFIPELAMEFRKAESYAGLRGRDANRTFLSIVTATPDGNDVTEVIELSKDELKNVNAVADSVLPKLESLDYNQSMGVLAQLASRIAELKDNK